MTIPKFSETDNGSAFVASAAARETDIKIMDAIAFFARNITEADALWHGDGFGTVCNVSDLWERVTNNGLHDAENFCWGAAGGKWLQWITA